MKNIKKLIFAITFLSSTTLGLIDALNNKNETQATLAVSETYEADSVEDIQSIFDSGIDCSHEMRAHLIADIYLDKTIYIYENTRTCIDLNGHVITAAYSGTDPFSMFDVKGEFTISDSRPNSSHAETFYNAPNGGVITGGHAERGGAILVTGNGKLNINGGTICDNRASIGGGIYSENNIFSGNQFSVCHNYTLDGETNNNVYLKEGAKFSINRSNSLYYQNDVSNIYISMENPGEFLSENGRPEYRNYFHSDDPNYRVAISTDNKLSLQIPTEINVEAENGKVTCEPEKVVEGDEVTFSYKADDGYVFDKAKVNNGDINIERVNDNSYKFIAGKTTSVTVKFIEDYVKRISWNKKPSETVKQGEEIDLSDVSLKVTMQSGKVQIVNVTSEMISGFDLNQIGEQTITISYGGKTTTFTIKVIKNNSGCNSGVLIGVGIGIVVLAVLIPLLVTRKKKENK